MFAYNKNYEQVDEEDDESASSNSDDLDNEDFQSNQKFITFTFDYLFRKILEFCED